MRFYSTQFGFPVSDFFSEDGMRCLVFFFQRGTTKNTLVYFFMKKHVTKLKQYRLETFVTPWLEV